MALNREEKVNNPKNDSAQDEYNDPILDSYKAFWEIPITDVIKQFLKSGSEKDFQNMHLRLCYAAHDEIEQKLVAQTCADLSKSAKQANEWLVLSLYSILFYLDPNPYLDKSLVAAQEEKNATAEGLAEYTMALAKSPDRMAFCSEPYEFFKKYWDVVRRDRPVYNVSALIHHLEKAFSKGVMIAGYELGILYTIPNQSYDRTEQVPVNSIVKAGEYFKKAGTAGDLRALLAMEKTEEAAKLGLPSALYMIVKTKNVNSGCIGIEKIEAIAYLTAYVKSGRYTKNSKEILYLLDTHYSEYQLTQIITYFKKFRQLVQTNKTDAAWRQDIMTKFAKLVYGDYVRTRDNKVLFQLLVFSTLLSEIEIGTYNNNAVDRLKLTTLKPKFYVSLLTDRGWTKSDTIKMIADDPDLWLEGNLDSIFNAETLKVMTEAWNIHANETTEKMGKDISEIAFANSSPSLGKLIGSFLFPPRKLSEVLPKENSTESLKP